MGFLQSPCSCSRCLAGNSSDASLEQIITLQKALNGTSAITDDAVDLIDMYMQEGFDAFIHMAYRYAALAHAASGILDIVAAYERKAADALDLRDGTDGPRKEV